jgi:hypothetical protein
MTLPEKIAAAAITRADAAIPTPRLTALVRWCAVEAWRALEIVLAGDLLLSRLDRTVDSTVRSGVEPLLRICGYPSLQAAPLAALRAARRDHRLDPPRFGLGAVIAAIPSAGGASTLSISPGDIAGAFKDYPALSTVLSFGEHRELVVDAARVLYRRRSHDDVELSRWAVPASETTERESALDAFRHFSYK